MTSSEIYSIIIFSSGKNLHFQAGQHENRGQYDIDDVSNYGRGHDGSDFCHRGGSYGSGLNAAARASLKNVVNLLLDLSIHIRPSARQLLHDFLVATH
jgi:hypothetical protein